jgi:hypothetical protein
MASTSIQEVVVLVGDVVENKIGTISRLLTQMVTAAAPIYEKLYHLQEEEEIKIVFKFSATVDETEEGAEGHVQAEGLVHNTKKLEGEVSVLCSHIHPYLDKKVWLETKGLMDTTFLTGNYYMC